MVIVTIEQYAEEAASFAVYPGRLGLFSTSGNEDVTGLLYASLGLCGESGEFADKVKKILRDCNGDVSREKRKELVAELGDVCWYVAACAAELGIDLEQVMQGNIAKLKDRSNRNAIQGCGDNR